jgi:hypothetical protein
MPIVGGHTAGTFGLKCRHRIARLCRLTCILTTCALGLHFSELHSRSVVSLLQGNHVSFFRLGILITRHRSFCVSHYAAGLRMGSAGGCPSLRRRLLPPDTSCLTSHRAKPLPEHLATECEGCSMGEMAHVLDRSRDWLLRSSQCGRTEDGVSTAGETARFAP